MTDLTARLKEAEALIKRAAKDVRKLTQPSRFDLDCADYVDKYFSTPPVLKHVFVPTCTQHDECEGYAICAARVDGKICARWSDAEEHL